MLEILLHRVKNELGHDLCSQKGSESGNQDTIKLFKNNVISDIQNDKEVVGHFNQRII